MDTLPTLPHTHGITGADSVVPGSPDHEHGTVDASGNPAITGKGLSTGITSLHHRVDRLEILMAITNVNARIIASNSRYDLSDPRPLQKTVPGHGLVLAQAAAQGLDPIIQQGIVAPPNPPAIGTTPPDFKPNIINYEHANILEMIIFYNEDFGIVPNDNMWTRVCKFREFLSGR